MNAHITSIDITENLQAGNHYFKPVPGRRQLFCMPAWRFDKAVVETADEALLSRLIGIVETHLPDETFDVGRLAAEAGLCRRQLHRKLRVLANQSPSRFIRTLRLERAVTLIRRNADTLAGIAYMCGFNTPNYFTKVFRQEFGCTPKTYREKVHSIIRNSEQKLTGYIPYPINIKI